MKFYHWTEGTEGDRRNDYLSPRIRPRFFAAAGRNSSPFLLMFPPPCASIFQKTNHLLDTT